jgi:hypothetical protein
MHVGGAPEQQRGPAHALFQSVQSAPPCGSDPERHMRVALGHALLHLVRRPSAPHGIEI